MPCIPRHRRMKMVATATMADKTGIALAAAGVGAVLVWSGINNNGVFDTLLSLLRGTKPTPGTPQAFTLGAAPGGTDTAGTGGAGLGTAAQNLVGDVTGTTDDTAPAAAGGSNAQNQALGKQLAASYGWGSGAEWDALNWIAMDESGWNDTIVNKSSTASGIAQNINGWSPSYQKGNAAQQITWMLNYIKSRYGDPIKAKTFHLANGWY